MKKPTDSPLVRQLPPRPQHIRTNPKIIAAIAVIAAIIQIMPKTIKIVGFIVPPWIGYVGYLIAI